MKLLRGLVVLIVLALVAVVALGAAEEAGMDVPFSIDSLYQEAKGQPVPEYAAPQPVAAPQPAVAPAAPLDDASNHTFMASDSSGLPARFNPCTPIRYTVNPSGATAGAIEDAQGAFNRLSEATGLQFEYVGETDAVPTSKWYDSGSGKEYPPVIVAWTNPAESNLLTPGASGNGGSDWLPADGSKVFVTGSVVLNTEHNDLYQPGFGPGMTRGNLLVHELGHVLGLGHAPNPGAVMYAQIGSATPETLSAGDLAGLEKLGTNPGCLPALSR